MWQNVWFSPSSKLPSGGNFLSKDFIWSKVVHCWLIWTVTVFLFILACNVLYINSVDMESLTGYEAINKAVASTCKQSPAPLTTLVHFKVSSQGITLTDTNRR